MPDGEHEAAVGQVRAEVVAGPPDAVVPLGHDQVLRAHARQLGHRLVVCLARRAPRRAEVELVHLRVADQAGITLQADCQALIVRRPV